MGKIPSGFRRAAAGSSQSALLKASTSSASALQEQIPSPVTRQSLKKSPKKEPTKVIAPAKKSNTPPIIFVSPNLSDAIALFNSYISSNKSIPSNPSFYNSILQSYSSISAPQNAIFFLNHMIKTHPSFSPDRFTYHVLLMQSCAVPDETSLANVHHALNLMKNTGFPPNQVTTDVAVRTLSGVGREEHAIELVKDLASQNVLPDTYTYNFLVRHLVKNRSLSTVNCFINDMREGFGIKPDLVTYTIMIDNVCNSKNLREAMRLLGVLSEEGYKPDCYVYNTIMKGYCLLSQGGEVMGVYKKMQVEGVKPDRYTYNTLIYGLSKTGMVKEARKFLGVMAEMGHFPDEVTYTSLMNGMCRQGDALGALALLEEMEAKGLTASVFGELWKLEPLSLQKKSMWRQMDWLLHVSYSIVELIPSVQEFPGSGSFEVMVTQQRSDLYVNLPALKKLDVMLINILDGFHDNEFYYVDGGMVFTDGEHAEAYPGSASSQTPSIALEGKWWLPFPKVPVKGLSEGSRRLLQHCKECTRQIFKAAVGINSGVLSAMEVPQAYLEGLPKSEKACLGEILYRFTTADQLISPDCLLDYLDLSSKYITLEIINRRVLYTFGE